MKQNPNNSLLAAVTVAGFAVTAGSGSADLGHASSETMACMRKKP